MMKTYTRWIPPVLWGILLAILSLMPGQQGTMFLFGIPHIDKIGHFGMYAIWALLVFLAWRGQSSFSLNKTLWLTFIFGLIAGILLELGQLVMSAGRVFEVYDIIANTLGTLAGAFAGKMLYQFTHKQNP